MEKILLLSDIHIGAGPDPETRFCDTLEHALARHGDARAIILTGDLTHTGSRAQYKTLASLLERVTIPVIPVTGNHDHRAELLKVFPGADRTPQGHVQTILDVNQHRIITLDTLEGPSYASHRHSGQLCPDRMAWLMRALESAGERHRIVISHHPAAKCGRPGIDAIRLREGPQLLELLSQFPGTMLISGHVHRAASGISRGVNWATLGPVWAPTALNLNDEQIRPGDQLPSYGVLLLQKHGACLQQQELST